MNVYFQEVEKVEDHLIVNGIDKSYTKWVLHGEPYGEHRHIDTTIDDSNEDEVNNADEPIEEIDEMLEDIGAGIFTGTTTGGESSNNIPTRGEYGTKDFDCLLEDATRPLYPGCERFSKLAFTVRLMHIKPYII
jgi:hypothetical protein